VPAGTSCGKCVEVCPTGALFRNTDTTAEKQPDASLPALLRTARDQHRWHNQ
jgi:bidirectional [NiFe] hydrogenase diaphorase subunit